MTLARTDPVASTSRDVRQLHLANDEEMEDVSDQQNGQAAEPMTFASKKIKNLSRLRSDKRYLEQVRSADVGQALQLKLASESPKYYPEYEATRLLNFFQAWVMDSEVGIEGLAVLNPYAKNLGDVIPPWDFIWTDNYLCDPSIRRFSQISPLPRINDYELTNELCANEGCNCEGEECDPSTCACLRRAADCYPYEGNHYQTMFAPADADVNAEGAAFEKRNFVYGHDGRLLPGVPLGTPIFECNKSCSCSSACRNRVVQKGKKARLAFVKTQEKGWGIKALEELPVGTFVGAYGGELLSDVEAERRADVYDRKLGTTYLQTVDSHIIKVHLTRQIIERDLAARFELDNYRGTAASKMKLVELVTKAADAIEVYEEYWQYLEAGNAAVGRLRAAEDRIRKDEPPRPDDDHIFARAKLDARKRAEEKQRHMLLRQQEPDSIDHPDKGLDDPVWKFLSLPPSEQDDIRRMALERSNMEDAQLVTVDSALWGNHTRFFNHSCDPNIYHVPVYTDDASIMRPLLAFFTRKKIDIDEELCFSYAGDMGSDDVDVALSAFAPQSPAKGRHKSKATMIHPPATRPGAETAAAITATAADSVAAANRPTHLRFLEIKCRCGAKNCTGRVF